MPADFLMLHLEFEDKLFSTWLDQLLWTLHQTKDHYSNWLSHNLSHCFDPLETDFQTPAFYQALLGKKYHRKQTHNSLIPEKRLEMSLCHLSKISLMSLEIVLSSLTISKAALIEGGLLNFLNFAHISEGLLIERFSKSVNSCALCLRLKNRNFLSILF